MILTGPTERQVKQILMREIRKAFVQAPDLPGELLTLELRVDDAGECGVLAMTSDNADKLTGFHHPRLLICVTEGKVSTTMHTKRLLRAARAKENRLFVYGNPTRPTGKFHDYAEGDRWHTLTIPATAHPNIVTGREETPGAVSEAFIDDMPAEYGRDSDVYRSRVPAQFPRPSAGGLLQRDWIRAAFDRYEKTGTHPLVAAISARARARRGAIR